MVMPHLNYKPKNVYISLMVISGGCDEVIPAGLDDMY